MVREIQVHSYKGITLYLLLFATAGLSVSGNVNLGEHDNFSSYI